MKYFFGAGMVIILSLIALPSYSQEGDSLKQVTDFSGSVAVTHNGMSLIPSFSLGKPAALVSLSAGRGRLSFEPELRFALEGKPWSFVFWWRYKLVRTNKWKVTLGAHPALNFKATHLPVNGGDTIPVLLTRRFLAGEFAPSYRLSEKVSLGMYYLYARGLDKDVTKNNYFITVNSSISQIRLPFRVYAGFTPQVYYLKQDRHDGFFVSATLNLERPGFPLSIQAIGNKVIRADIPGAKDFIWNTSLVYSFHKKFHRLPKS